MRLRVALGGLGALVGVYGAYLLISLGFDNLVAAAIWLAAGVLLHDGVLGPLMIVVGAIAVVAVPRRVRGPIAAGLVVLATVTMTAVPVIGRFGERPDNATLLPRNYTVGWLVFAGLVVVGTALATARSLRDQPEPAADVVREPHGARPVRSEDVERDPHQARDGRD